MKEIKKYIDIVRYGKSSTQNVIKVGDTISITEKVDGANASFTIDEGNTSGVSCYSRRLPLSEENTLQGFYGWVNENIVPIKDELHPNFRYIGEWMTPHKIQYKEEYKKTFLLFSIWDEDAEKYLSDDVVQYESERLGLKTVEYFYYGEFISYEHMASYIGKSNITKVLDTGEGIVVKNVDYFNRSGEQVFVKLVSEAFAEVQKQKLPKNPNIHEKEKATLMSVMTKARVDKILHKLVDEELIEREDFIIGKMGQLIRLIAPRILEDMIKEENEVISTIEETILHKLVGKSLPLVIKDVLREYEMEEN